MYHPLTNDAGLEWVELYNQMTVDVDISGWSLDKAVQFTFPQGTIIHGRGYIVVAASPTNLAAASGYLNALGPFTNHFSNAGEEVDLLNNSGRLMDVVIYGVEGNWPAAADGAGPSLAKIDPAGASAAAESWAASRQSGGTPGGQNFLPPGGFNAPPGLVSYWSFNDTNAAVADLLGGNHGTLSADVARVSGLVGSGALAFGATTNAFVNIGAGVVNNFSVSDGITIEALIKPAWNGTGAADIFRKEELIAGDLVSYWSFDESPSGTGTALDPISGNNGSFLGTAARTNGLAGPGAARFNNSAIDGVNVGAGLNNSFSMSTGITLFARIKPAWSGTSGDYDEIFRKEDGANRILLSFQNDGYNGGATPPVSPGPVLSFGLNVGGIYGELDMPLDGVAGRPTLAQLKDGNTHSVAASYDSVTGRKAIYFDGTLRWSTVISGPISSGGGAAAVIGNTSTGGGEPFSGIIDEVAIWRTALTSSQIASLAAGGSPLAIGASASPAASTRILLGFQNDANNAAANPPVAPGPVLSFGLNIGGVYGELDMPLDGVAGRPTLGQLTDGNTHHLAATYDRATGLKTLYIDGTGRFSNTLAGVVTSGGSGAAIIGNSAVNGTEPFNGTLDEVAFWNRALTLTEVSWHFAATQMGQDYFANAATTNRPILTFDYAWRFEQSGIDLGTAWRAPGYNDSAWPSGPGLLAYETCNCLPEPIRTALTTNTTKTTFYFRTHFSFTGNVAQAQLSLRHIIDDGAVFYLNGAEIWRIGMPSGDTTYGTISTRGVDNAGLEGPFSIPATNLLYGDNVLAVEVHQTATTSSDIVFGLALDSLETIFVPGGNSFSSQSLPKIAFNELSTATNAAFWFELVNYDSIDFVLDGCVIERFSATNRAYTFPPLTLAAGEFLVMTKATLGFGVDPGDKLVLYAADHATVLDAVVAKREARARHPDGTGEWLLPNVPTPGASNEFLFHNEIVINEIMYHHRGVAGTPALYSPTNQLLTFTNTWRFHAQGVDPGTAWYASGFDDSGWQTGAALLYNSPSAFPIPKNTLLPATNVLGPRIITYYFRTPFNFTGDPATASLSFRSIVDDGAIYYLNGREVFRQNMPSGPITYGTVASLSVGVATFAGPFGIPATNLVAGENWLAVEVHRISTVDNDVVFGMELLASVQLAPAVPFHDSAEAWIELFNRSSGPVDLTGWRLRGAINFLFAPGRMLAPGAYLVVAGDVDSLRSLYPALDIVGPFTGHLSHANGKVVLDDPYDNPANQATYFDGGRWPSWADGGGASLELRDPQSDNTKGEAWAASLESGKSLWTNITYRMVATSTGSQPSQWNEFIIGLLDNGECLIDDVSVIESPTNSPLQLIQNGAFETGRTGWRFLGDHAHSEVIPEPGNPGNHVLHLVASGTMEHMHNHLETTFTGNHPVVNGRLYEISFRAKWIIGDNQLNTRLYFNRAAQTSLLPVPALTGTPGARNSSYTTNAGPTFANFHHSRVVPLPGEPVSVSIAAGDPQGVASCAVFWSANNGAWQSAGMAEDFSRSAGSSAGIAYHTFAGSIPGYPAGTVIQFYVTATDNLGVLASYPAAGTNSRALYAVNDGQAALALAHNVRIIMTPADDALLHALTNVMSNELLGCTVVTDENRVYYDTSIRLKGSERGRDQPQRESYHLQFNPEELFRGVHPVMLVDRSGGWRYGTTFGQDEIIINHMINRAGGIPSVYYDLVRVIAPQSAQTGPALFFPRLEDNFLDLQFDHGGNGNVYEFELVYYPLTTSDGTPQGYKLPEPDNVLAVDISDLGNDKEQYRYNYITKINRNRDDFSGLIAFAKSFSLNGTALEAATAQTMDVDQWMRAFAMMSLCGVGDAYTQGNNHNVRLFVRPGDEKVLVFPSDWDFAFVQAVNSALRGDQNLAKVIDRPVNQRLFYGHLLDLISTAYDASYMGSWIEHYNRFTPGQNFSAPGSGGQPPILSYISQRASFVLGQLPVNAPFAITSNGGNDFGTTNSTATLSGTAPLAVKSIEVNGVSHPIIWTSVTNWTLTVPLFSGLNRLAAQGVDTRGNRLTNAMDNIAITNSGPGALLPVVINEWMANNGGLGGFPDPVDGLHQDWFELFNPNTSPVSLDGFYLTDTLSQPTKWQIPNGTVIVPRGFLLVWADNQIAQNGLGPFGDLHANFQLNNNGEAIGLFAPDGTPQSSVFFGPQTQNISQGLFPDGDTNSIYSMMNWTPRGPNQLGAPASPQLGAISLPAGGLVSFSFNAIPGRTYRVEYKDDLDASVWTLLGTPRLATSNTIAVSDNIGTAPQRFYRAALVP